MEDRSWRNRVKRICNRVWKWECWPEDFKELVIVSIVKKV